MSTDTEKLTEAERGELDNALNQFWHGDADEDGVAGTVEQLILAPRFAGWVSPETLAEKVREAYLRGTVDGDRIQASLSMEWDNEHTFPFVEDENANITGYGHQDKEAFAAQVNRYDEITGGEPNDPEDLWTADAIGHGWATLDPDNDERLVVVAADALGAFPITTLWGAR